MIVQTQERNPKAHCLTQTRLGPENVEYSGQGPLSIYLSIDLVEESFR